MSSRETGHRFTGLFGLAFVLAYFTYVVMLDSPDISVSSRDALVYWANSGNQARSVLAASICGLAALLFLGFTIGLAERLDAGGAALPAHAVRATGAVTTTMLLLGGALFSSPALALALNNEAVPMNVDLGVAIRASSFVAHPVMLWFTSFGAAGVVAATTAGRATLAWRPWASVAGGILVILLLVPLVFFGLMILLPWTAVVSLWALRTRVDRHSANTSSPIAAT